MKGKAIHKDLMQKYEGLFEVLKKVGNVAYKLKLLYAYKIHSTFHVNFLKSFHKDVTKMDRK